MELFLVVLLICRMVPFVFCGPGQRAQNQRVKRESDEFIIVKEFDVSSTVVSRFADVHIKSVIYNSDVSDREVGFQVRVPKSAFIQSFWLNVNNKTIRAEIKEKHEAEQIYNDAKVENITAGKVSQRVRLTDDINADVFGIKVNVGAQNMVEFHLQYQELLERFTGKYRQMIYIETEEEISKLSVTCEVRERENFTNISYKTPYSPDMQYTDIEESVTDDGLFSRTMTWEPLEGEQADFGKVMEPFIIEYELEPSEPGGYVYYSADGEFAHLFSLSCSQSNIMSKQIVFVIDVSGSMKGTPINQVSRAMNSILSQLRENDYFNIVLFSRKIIIWNPRFIQATDINLRLAKEYLDDHLIALSATNINEALLRALRLFETQQETLPGTREAFVRSIIFLTDGEATEGVTNVNDIRANVRSANFYGGIECCKVSIFTIAFGVKADRDFLRVMANENGGYPTVIKENEDDEANTQLLESYESIQNPTLRNVKFSFMSDEAFIPKENITQSSFLQYDCGSEIIVGGWSKPGLPVSSQVEADGSFEKIKFNTIPSFETTDVNSKFLARMVQYKRVKEFLKVAEMSTDEQLQSEATEMALQMALEYKFVTPLTSLVVTEFRNKPRANSDPYINNRSFFPRNDNVASDFNLTSDTNKSVEAPVEPFSFNNVGSHRDGIEVAFATLASVFFVLCL